MYKNIIKKLLVPINLHNYILNSQQYYNVGYAVFYYFYFHY